jgi:hypothetical protein
MGRVAGVACVGLALLGFGVGASAATVTTAGQSFSVAFGGQVEGSTQPGLTSEAKFTLDAISTDRKFWTFSVDLKNTSSTPITGSRVSILGFNTDPNVNRPLSSVSGVYDIIATGNMPGVGTVEICFKGAGGPNCSGGGGEGVLKGATAAFTAVLAFNNTVTSLVLDNFTVRYQSIVGSGFGTSGIGRGTAGDVAPVPLPAAFWLFGSGILALMGVRRARRVRVVAG